MDIKTSKGEEFVIGALDKKAFIDNYQIWANNDGVTHYAFQGTFPITAADAEEMYEQIIDPSNVVFGIYSEGNLIGICGIYDIFWPSRVGEFRILIGDKRYWRLGIGLSCLNYLTKLAFERYNLHKLWLGYNEDNKGAAKSYSKSEFQQECVIKEGHYRNGKYYNLIRMCMFRKDYFK